MLALLTPFSELNMKKDVHSKMDDLDYSEMSMQSYLTDPKMKVSEARTIFRFRTRMTKFWGNFKGGRPPQVCIVCKEAQSTDTQQHIFECKALAQIINIEGKYEEIFRTVIDEKLVKTLENVMKIREEMGET